MKFNDQAGCREEHIKEFDQLPFKNKVCFTVKEYPEYKSVIKIKSPSRYETVRGTYEPFGRRREINVTELLNRL